MRGTYGRLGIAVAIAALVAGCGSDKAPEMMHLRSTKQGPDEFSIVPTKPLQMPGDLALLPAPTPGGSNITDPTPAADAIAALGGNVARTSQGRDGALLTQAGRFGTTPGIRQELAAEDLTFRKENDGKLLQRLFSITTYFQAYEPMMLNQRAELERWRARGLPTPAAPPSGRAQENSR